MADLDLDLIILVLYTKLAARRYSVLAKVLLLIRSKQTLSKWVKSPRTERKHLPHYKWNKALRYFSFSIAVSCCVVSAVVFIEVLGSSCGASQSWWITENGLSLNSTRLNKDHQYANTVKERLGKYQGDLLLALTINNSYCPTFGTFLLRYPHLVLLLLCACCNYCLCNKDIICGPVRSVFVLSSPTFLYIIKFFPSAAFIDKLRSTFLGTLVHLPLLTSALTTRCPRWLSQKLLKLQAMNTHLPFIEDADADPFCTTSFVGGIQSKNRSFLTWALFYTLLCHTKARLCPTTDNKHLLLPNKENILQNSSTSR